MQLDHVRSRDHFVQNSQRRWSKGFRWILSILALSSQLDLDLHLSQALDESFHTGASQRLDQFIGRSFVGISDKYDVTGHAIKSTLNFCFERCVRAIICTDCRYPAGPERKQ